MRFEELLRGLSAAAGGFAFELIRGNILLRTFFRFLESAWHTRQDCRRGEQRVLELLGGKKEGSSKSLNTKSLICDSFF